MDQNGALPPGPRFYTAFGILRALRRDPLGFNMAVWRQYGDLVCFRVGANFRSWMAVHPDHVKHVLHDHPQRYVKGEIIGRAKVLIGEGLFTSEGDFWRRQRRLAQPAFHRQRIAAFAAIMTDCTAALLEEWAPRAVSGAAFDVAADMSRLTLRVVGKTLFSRDLDGEAAEVGRALLEALEFVNHRAMTPVLLPLWVPTARHLRFRRARRALDRVVFGIIEARHRSGHDVGDLLSMLLHARDEDTGEGMSDRQLRDEVMTFVLAGHETTALALSWTWYLLATHREVEEHLRSEVRAALGGGTPTVEDLPRLGYARMVIEETLRLYPPLWAFGRQTIADDDLGGYHLPPDTMVTLSPHLTHRHPDFWPDPERFDPERFTPERAAARHRFAYLPFSGGPRLCIGNEFALMEATLVLAMIVQRYRLRLVPGRLVEPEVRTTLRPRGGLAVTLERA